MSILNDDRRVSDDLWEYSEWLNERNREFRGADVYPEDSQDCYDEEETEDNDD